MSDEQKPNGEEIESILQVMLQEQLINIVGFLDSHAHLSDEQTQALANTISNEQLQILDQILPTLVDHHSHPTIGIEIWNNEGVRGIVKAPKRMENITDPGEALHFAFMLSLLSAPGPRAILRAYGFNYRFVQSKEKPRSIKPTIVV